MSTTTTDSFNVTLLAAPEVVDDINKRFYGRHNYPWPASLVPVYPAGVAEIFLNQDTGCWDRSRIPEGARIWVAGCGRNQALLTALKFPSATVLGTDLSPTSLEACTANARSIGVTNLTLEERSLNDIDYDGAFDYIICTGVVHHNADPAATLRRIARALKPNGVLELMVYNYYHRLMTTACQRAIRNFYDTSGSLDMDLELSLIRQLMTSFPYQNLLGQFVKAQAAKDEAEMADLLLQPVEYSYTVESLGHLLHDAGLEYLVGCLNPWDTMRGAITWNTCFADSALQRRYDALPDPRRWQISNLLMFNESPMLWFYCQRPQASAPRKTERQICDEFLEMRFTRSAFHVQHYVLNHSGEYVLDPDSTWAPGAGRPDGVVDRVLAASRPDQSMRDVLRGLGVDTTFQAVNDIRLQTTTSALPHLIAVTS